MKGALRLSWIPRGTSLLGGCTKNDCSTSHAGLVKLAPLGVIRDQYK